MTYGLIALAALVVGGALAATLTYFYLQSKAGTKIGRAELDAKRIVEDASRPRRLT